MEFEKGIREEYREILMETEQKRESETERERERAKERERERAKERERETERERGERGVGQGPGDLCRRWGFSAGSEVRRSCTGYWARVRGEWFVQRNGCGGAVGSSIGVP